MKMLKDLTVNSLAHLLGIYSSNTQNKNKKKIIGPNSYRVVSGSYKYYTIKLII